MGRQSRRKSERRESPESVRFRTHLAAEYFEDMVSQLPVVDMASLCALAACVSTIVDGARLLPLIEPRGPVDDHLEYDRAVCETGLKEFFRRVMPSDYPRGPALDPKTRKPDPSIPIPDVDLGEFVRVFEVKPGFRARRFEEIEVIVPPKGAALA